MKSLWAARRWTAIRAARLGFSMLRASGRIHPGLADFSIIIHKALADHKKGLEGILDDLTSDGRGS